MNWLIKICRTVSTNELPELLRAAIEYECGGKWELSSVKSWTQELENITNDPTLGLEVGYSTSFWVFCKTGDDMFHEKWGVRINFTVTSGTSETTFDTLTGDWDLEIIAHVQWASPESWTSQCPYPILVRSVGKEKNMRTIQEVANFVKSTIWRDQRDDDDDGDGDNDDDEPDMFPEWPYSEEDINEETMAIVPGQIRGKIY